MGKPQAHRVSWAALPAVRSSTVRPGPAGWGVMGSALQRGAWSPWSPEPLFPGGTRQDPQTRSFMEQQSLSGRLLTAQQRGLGWQRRDLRCVPAARVEGQVISRLVMCPGRAACKALFYPEAQPSSRCLEPGIQRHLAQGSGLCPTWHSLVGSCREPVGICPGEVEVGHVAGSGELIPCPVWWARPAPETEPLPVGPDRCLSGQCHCV